MHRQREQQRETGDDYIPGNKCGLSTAGTKMLSEACGLGDVSGSGLLNNKCISAFMCKFIHSLCVWTYASMHVCDRVFFKHKQ